MIYLAFQRPNLVHSADQSRFKILREEKERPSYREETGTNKTIFRTLITTFGLNPNEYSMKTSILPLCFFLFAATGSRAQQEFFYKDIFGKNDGLTATPTCMVEDDDGFLWVGTANGLFRFDGSRAREIKFYPEDSLAHDSRKVNSLAINGKQGILWIATSTGVFRYQWRKGISQRLAAESLFSKSDYKFPICTKIFRDRQGELWANFAAPGLVHLKDGGTSVERFTWEVGAIRSGEKPSWSNANYIQCFAQDAFQDSIIWAGTKAGLIRFNKVTRSIRHFYYAHPNSSISSKANPIQSILAHPDGNIYLGSYNGGLVVFNPATERFSHYLVHPEASLEKERLNNVNFILPYTKTQIWAAREGEIFLFDTKTRQFTQTWQHVSASFIDKSGNYWAFGAGGLALYHHVKNQVHRLLFPNEAQYKTLQIVRIREDTSTHIIYVRAEGLKGLPAYNRRTQQWKMLRFPIDTSIILDGQVLEKIGAGILANDRERFYLLPPGTDKFKPFPLRMPENPGWMFSQKGPDGSVFISATKGYLFWLKPGARDVQTFYRADIGEPFPEHFTSPTISDFDRFGRPWITCYGGFSIFVPGENRFIHVSTRQNRERHVEQYRMFSPDQHGRMWCLGMNEIGWIDPEYPEQGLQQRFGKSNGYMLEELGGGFGRDAKGRFWFKSDKNLARFDPEIFELTLFEDLGIEQPTILEGGELAFYNPRGIGLMHPDSLQQNTEQPKPYVAWFKIFDREKTLGGDLFSPPEIRLKPEENFFSIGLSALGFFNPQKFRFAYQLAGVDKDWVYPESDNRIASYTDVRGGAYTFRLKVSNSLGVWNETPFEWRIHVGTPWWARWWFRLIIGAAIAFAVYFLVKNRLRQQQMLLENQRLLFEKELSLRNERDRIAAEMHDDLGAGLSTIRFLSLLAKEKERDPVKSERIDKIAHSAAEVMEKMADIIWVMNSRNDTLENFTNHFRRYAGDYLDTHGIRFFFEIPDALPPIILSGAHRRNLLLALKECLHNVVKHAGATEVHIRVLPNKRLEITVADNGRGIPGEFLQHVEKGNHTGMGNGLHNLHRRMETLGGTLEIENHRGTSVTLRTGILIAP